MQYEGDTMGIQLDPLRITMFGIHIQARYRRTPRRSIPEGSP
jgi:hypothetical protein